MTVKGCRFRIGVSRSVFEHQLSHNRSWQIGETAYGKSANKTDYPETSPDIAVGVSLLFERPLERPDELAVKRLQFRAA